MERTKIGRRRCVHEECSGSNRTFVGSYELRRHEKEQHGMHGYDVTVFVCQEDGCGRGFKRQEKLDSHIRICRHGSCNGKKKSAGSVSLVSSVKVVNEGDGSTITQNMEERSCSCSCCGDLNKQMSRQLEILRELERRVASLENLNR